MADRHTTNTVLTFLFALVGAAVGLAYMPDVWLLFHVPHGILNNTIVNIVIGLIIFLLLASMFANKLSGVMDRIETFLARQSPTYLFFGSISTIIGLVLAYLISLFFFRLPSVLLNTVLPMILMLSFGYFGFRLGTTRRDEWRKAFRFRTKKEPGAEASVEPEITDRPLDDNYHHYKILDTNILIDGRIYDIAKTGFLEGTLLVPDFVLHELQYIADASDSVKRVRGRRGLDVLNKLQSENIVPVEAYAGDFPEISEVDDKLIALAKKVNGVIMTNDYNLNKVIQFQQVEVLNINELASALKARAIPGENLHVMVVKNGTERQQGVAYLDDGTMVVVEDGKFYINQWLDVIVTSSIQTDAGRMIFAKPAHASKTIEHHDKKKK
ncbi:PIN/TRAM domain-containing protein [Levilactobacillus bambusae]|uniref:PIN domain nuclease n=1 Tax=Levilactobacillus bambusae TaxID=2024736 RepID=A0A2V1MXV1_9LACO|nr:PIN domain-containing protein [Levilactobacillus bambusae]PWF99367.1 PIN domain nuclease [Levilactobacillus bambusae]